MGYSRSPTNFFFAGVNALRSVPNAQLFDQTIRYLAQHPDYKNVFESIADCRLQISHPEIAGRIAIQYMLSTALKSGPNVAVFDSVSERTFLARVMLLTNPVVSGQARHKKTSLLPFDAIDGSAVVPPGDDVDVRSSADMPVVPIRIYPDRRVHPVELIQPYDTTPSPYGLGA